MAGKLRKMLGRADDQAIIDLMRLIETQSHATLNQWAVKMAGKYALTILHAHEVTSLDGLYAQSCAYLRQEQTLKELKDIFQEATKTVRELKDPIVTAAARALLTACKTIQTPTNALGYVFYLAAAVAYQELGEMEKPETYDARAQALFVSLFHELEIIAIPDEKNPVRVNWNC